jgi:CHASE3 domain sensor protein
MDKTFRIILIVFAVLAFSLIGVVAYSLHNLQRAHRSAQWVDHTHAYMAEITAAVAALRTAEGALNAYLLSDSPVQEVSFRHAFAELAERIEVAKAMAEGDAQEAADLAGLEQALLDRAERARTLLSAHRAGATESVQEQLWQEEAGSGLIVSRLAQRIIIRQQNLLRERDRIAFEQDAAARATLYLGAGLNLLLLIVAGWFIRDGLRARQREAESLIKANAGLEARVEERTAELAQSNRKLRAESLEGRWKTEALDHQLRYNHLIIARVASPIIVITRALNISRVNPALESLAGKTVIDLVDLPLQQVVSLTESKDALDPIASALRDGRDLIDISAQIKRTDRPALPVLLCLYPLQDQNHVVGGVVTLRTLSDPSSNRPSS